jgi:4-amino-4-deoxy-L-arabinose transferase-like glycosyltransferase
MKKRRDTPGRQTPQSAPLSFDQQARWWLAGILLLALAVRLLGLWSLSGTIYYDYLLWDERIYHQWAARIADGTFASKSVYEFPPLYAYLVAALYKAFGPDPAWQRILNVGFGVFTCAFVYLIGKALAGRVIGLVAALGAALYKPLIFYSAVPLKEMFGICLFALLVWLLLSLDPEAEGGAPGEGTAEPVGEHAGGIGRHARLLRAGALGVTLGLLINVRPNAGIFLLLIPLILLWHSHLRTPALKAAGLLVLAFLLGTALAVSPFVVRNYRAAGELTLTTSQGGFNLHLANNPQNRDPYFWPVPFATTSPFEMGTQYTIEASRRLGKRLTPGEASRYWTLVTVGEALERPGAFVRRMGEKTLALFNRYEAGDHYGISFVSSFAKFFQIPFLAFWFVMPLGMAGIVLAWRSRNTKTLAVLSAAYGATLIAFIVVDRYRLLLMTILIPFAAVALVRLYRMLREQRLREAAVPFAVALVFALIEFLPIPGAGDTTSYYNTHAIILDSRGYTAEALRYWKTSSDMNGRYSDFARVPLAAKYYTVRRIPEGNAYLQLIGEDSYFAAAKYELLGDYYFRDGRLPLAAAAYERALQINSGLRPTRGKLIHVYRSLAPDKVPAEEEKLKEVNSFYDLLGPR